MRELVFSGQKLESLSGLRRLFGDTEEYAILCSYKKLNWSVVYEVLTEYRQNRSSLEILEKRCFGSSYGDYQDRVAKTRTQAIFDK